MLMQNRSPNAEEINTNSLDSNQSFIENSSRTNTNIDYCEDTKSSSDYEDLDNSNVTIDQDSNQAVSLLDNSNNINNNSSIGNNQINKPKKKKKKSNNVQVKMPDDDKSGIKLKIRRTNNINQDENHVIVDNDLQHRRRQQQQQHFKSKRSKTLIVGSNSNDGNLSDGCSLPTKRSRNNNDTNTESGGEDTVITTSRSSSVGVNTCNKGTEIDESCLGSCQAGTKLTLESVVLMETQSGILIVSVQWRGKTLMGALMEAERFQIGSLEKDSIYRREKMMGMNRRNTRRKAKNLFGKKKRKTATPTDSSELGGGANDTETGNSDIDSPYMCDKENCFMKFRDLHSLRVHIYQLHHNNHHNHHSNHRHHSRIIKEKMTKDSSSNNNLSMVMKHEPMVLSQPNNPDAVLPNIVQSNNNTSNNLIPSSNNHSDDRVITHPSSGAFSPAYSDISDANEAPVLENEAEIKPPSVLNSSGSNISTNNSNSHTNSHHIHPSHNHHNNIQHHNHLLNQSSNSNVISTNPISHSSIPPPLNLTPVQNNNSTNHSNNPNTNQSQMLSRHIFSPSAPQLQPEVNLASPYTQLRLPNSTIPANPSALLNGIWPNFNTQSQSQNNNGSCSKSSTTNLNNENLIQDLSINNLLTKTAAVATGSSSNNHNHHSHHHTFNKSNINHAHSIKSLSAPNKHTLQQSHYPHHLPSLSHHSHSLTNGLLNSSNNTSVNSSQSMSTTKQQHVHPSHISFNPNTHHPHKPQHHPHHHPMHLSDSSNSPSTGSTNNGNPNNQPLSNGSLHPPPPPPFVSFGNQVTNHQNNKYFSMSLYHPK